LARLKPYIALIERKWRGKTWTPGDFCSARTGLLRWILACKQQIANLVLTAFFSAMMPLQVLNFAFSFSGRVRWGAWQVLLLVAMLGVARPAAGQAQLQRNALPKAYHGPRPGGADAQPDGLVRVVLRVVDAEGNALSHALVRVAGSPQQLWADATGAICLLVNLERGPLRLTCSCFGYDDAQLSVERPEDNNLVFQLFKTKPMVVASPPR
jgi:hypothetical protein